MLICSMNRAFFLIFWGYIKDTWIARHFYPHVVGIAQVRASAKELGGWRTLNTPGRSVNGTETLPKRV